MKRAAAPLPSNNDLNNLVEKRIAAVSQDAKGIRKHLTAQNPLPLPHDSSVPINYDD